MSSENESLAQFVASVMARLYGLRKKGQDLVESLHLEALGGSRKAKDTLDNPWNSSVPPSRWKRGIETRLDQVRGELELLGPGFLAAVLELERLEKQREYQQDRERASEGTAAEDGAGLLEPGYDRLFKMLRDQAKISSRDAMRVSEKAILQFGRVIKRQSEDRWCDRLVSVREISRAGLLQHVSIPVGWSVTTGEVRYIEHHGLRWYYDPVEGFCYGQSTPDLHLNPVYCVTILPAPLSMDPPDLPRGWTPDGAAEMHPVLWDSSPDEPFYRSFVRSIEAGEDIALYRPCALLDYEEPTPSYPNVEAMIRFDEDFRAAYQRADRRFRVLDGHHAGLDGMTLDKLAASDRERDRELLDWAFPVATEVLFNTPLWDAWRPWGTLLAALEDYLDYRATGERGCLVFAWAYYLKGRLAQTDAELPVFIREAMFDWTLLPVPSLLAPAVRVLVPRDKLEAQPLPDGEDDSYAQPERDTATLDRRT